MLIQIIFINFTVIRKTKNPSNFPNILLSYLMKYFLALQPSKSNPNISALHFPTQLE